MCPIQNKPGSDNIGEAFIKDGDIRGADQNLLKSKYHQANSINIVSIFNFYGIDAGIHQKKICCPFPSHEDSSASFYFYPNTNSFFCYGCKVGGKSVEFISTIEDISKIEAAEKILSGFSNIANINVSIQKDFLQRQETLLNFSNYIRETRIKFSHLSKELEDICMIFDTLNSRHSLDNDGLRSLIKKLKAKIECQLA